jgi:hypothetical protein
LHWDHVATTADCFYFSGPEGRDDALVGTAVVERDDTRVKVTINTATFEGSYREGTLDLMRISSHEFDGPWLAFETLHGSVRGGVMTAHYRYTECEVARECPGRCALTGEVTFKAIR